MLTQFGAFLLPAVPLLALVAFLLLGRFPGEEAIERLSRRIAGIGRGPGRCKTSRRSPGRPDSWTPRGGLLIATGIATRPPPSAL